MPQAACVLGNPATAMPRELLESFAEEPFVARQFGPYRTIREIGRAHNMSDRHVQMVIAKARAESVA